MAVLVLVHDLALTIDLLYRGGMSSVGMHYINALALTINLLRQIVNFTSPENFDRRNDTLIDALN